MREDLAKVKDTRDNGHDERELQEVRDEPGEHVHRVVEAHDLHDFFEAEFFFDDDRLCEHRHRVDERNGQAEWHDVLDYLQEVVDHVAGIRHLVEVATRL